MKQILILKRKIYPQVYMPANVDNLVYYNSTKSFYQALINTEFILALPRDVHSVFEK